MAQPPDMNGRQKIRTCKYFLIFAIMLASSLLIDEYRGVGP